MHETLVRRLLEPRSLGVVADVCLCSTDPNSSGSAIRHSSLSPRWSTVLFCAQQHQENADRSLQLEGEDRGASDSAQNFGPREERECEEWRRCRLDPLWDGLGSLGERLASVDDLFNQLEQDLDHDQQASYKAGAQAVAVLRCRILIGEKQAYARRYSQDVSPLAYGVRVSAHGVYISFRYLRRIDYRLLPAVGDKTGFSV